MRTAIRNKVQRFNKLSSKIKIENPKCTYYFIAFFLNYKAPQKHLHLKRRTYILS